MGGDPLTPAPKFRCEHCGSQFFDDSTAAGRDQEFRATFGCDPAEGEIIRVCDVCYEWAIKRAREMGLMPH
jgi:hypothetical protein